MFKWCQTNNYNFDMTLMLKCCIKVSWCLRYLTLFPVAMARLLNFQISFLSNSFCNHFEHSWCWFGVLPILAHVDSLWLVFSLCFSVVGNEPLIKYSLNCSNLLKCFNNSLCPKLDDPFHNQPNWELFLKI
jgi:hypothetical protein